MKIKLIKKENVSQPWPVWQTALYFVLVDQYRSIGVFGLKITLVPLWTILGLLLMVAWWFHIFVAPKKYEEVDIWEELDG